MPMFKIHEKDKLLAVEQKNFPLEKDLQCLIESNLQVIFACRFVASEYSTGSQHAGRIDTLALSEDGNPVIIEYKKVESPELINQSLSYLHWIQGHKGDFEIVVQQSLGNGVIVDWSAIRVICIAPKYRKHDLNAVQVRGANIELWKYRLYANASLYLENIFHDSKISLGSQQTGKNKILNDSNKNNLVARVNPKVTLTEHFDEKPKAIQKLAHSIQEYILGLDSTIEEVARTSYIAYKTSKNIACLSIRSKKFNSMAAIKTIRCTKSTFNL